MRAQSEIDHLRCHRSEMATASNAPGIPPNCMADVQASDFTIGKPCATRSVGTHEVNPYQPSVWNVQTKESVNVVGRIAGFNTAPKARLGQTVDTVSLGGG